MSCFLNKDIMDGTYGPLFWYHLGAWRCSIAVDFRCKGFQNINYFPPFTPCPNFPPLAKHLYPFWFKVKGLDRCKCLILTLMVVVVSLLLQLCLEGHIECCWLAIVLAFFDHLFGRWTMGKACWSFRRFVWDWSRVRCWFGSCSMGTQANHRPSPEYRLCIYGRDCIWA